MTEKDHKALSRLIMYDKIKHYYCAILSKLTPCNYHLDPLFSQY